MNTQLTMNLYDTLAVKKTLDTEISEFSNIPYDYAPGPELKIIYPVGNEIFYVGQPMNIRWSGELLDLAGPVGIFYVDSDNKSTAMFPDVSDIPASAGNIIWNIPLDIPLASYNLQIKSGWNGNSISYITENPIYIRRKYIAVLSFPKTDIVANNGQTLLIKWQSSDISDYIKIELIDVNGQIYDTIESKYYTDGNFTYSWIVNNIKPVNTGMLRIAIKITDYNDISISHVGEYFDIKTPNVYDINLFGYETKATPKL